MYLTFFQIRGTFNAGEVPLQCLQPNNVYLILPKAPSDSSTSTDAVSLFKILQHLACNRLALVSKESKQYK